MKLISSCIILIFVLCLCCCVTAVFQGDNRAEKSEFKSCIEAKKHCSQNKTCKNLFKKVKKNCKFYRRTCHDEPEKCTNYLVEIRTHVAFHTKCSCSSEKTIGRRRKCENAHNLIFANPCLVWKLKHPVKAVIKTLSDTTTAKTTTLSKTSAEEGPSQTEKKNVEKKTFEFPLLKIFANMSPDKSTPFREAAFGEKTPTEFSSNQNVTPENIKNSDVIRPSIELDKKNTSSKVNNQNRATNTSNKNISAFTTTENAKAKKETHKNNKPMNSSTQSINCKTNQSRPGVLVVAFLISGLVLLSFVLVGAGICIKRWRRWQNVKKKFEAEKSNSSRSPLFIRICAKGLSRNKINRTSRDNRVV